MSTASRRIQISVSGSPLSSAASTPCHTDDGEESSEEEFGSSDEEEIELGSSRKLPKEARRTSVENIKDNESMEFPINGECTSLSLSPSGNFLWAGFSDGTLRVFDLTGRFGLERDAAVASRQKSSLLVASKWCQAYGAVACQIHARGVHTDLITKVGVCDDYVFCGVSRGAMELYAVDFRDLELGVRNGSSAAASANNKKNKKNKKDNILDYLHVHEKADAKLKGFGACTRLQGGNSERPTYLLLTGKGIKNIHIWSFQPPLTSNANEEPIWTQLYDTQTNGNTINLLGFYRTPNTGKLLGVSKSDSQKVRLWDLSTEEDESREEEERPKRPPYVDVVNSQAALGLAAGGFCVCGGPTMFNQLSIVSLDQPKNAYNHTELALPGGIETRGGDVGAGGRRGSSRRQRRGDLKQVVNVASPPEGDANAGQVLLELDDGTIVQYTMSNTTGSVSKLQVLQLPTIPALPEDYWKRTICLASSKHHHLGALIVAMSLYNPNTQKGRLVLRKLPGTEQEGMGPPSLKAAPSEAPDCPSLQTPPHRQSTLTQPHPPIVAKKSGATSGPKMAFLELANKKLRLPPSTSKTESKSKSSRRRSKSTLEERTQSKEKKKRKKKQKNLGEGSTFKRRPSDSELATKVETQKQKFAELKRDSSSKSHLEASETFVQQLDIKAKSKREYPPEMVVTPLRHSKGGGIPTFERIYVKRIKVIPMSTEKKANEAASAATPPAGGDVSISSPTTTSEKSKKKGNTFETPPMAAKNRNSRPDVTTPTITNPTAAKSKQVSPEAPSSSSLGDFKPTKAKGEMDRFLVPQKQLKMAQKAKKPKLPNPVTKQQHQKQLKVSPVSRRKVPRKVETMVDPTNKVEDGKEKSRNSEELVTEETNKGSKADASSNEEDENPSKLKDGEPSKKKRSRPDSPPPSRESVHAFKVRAELKRIQGLIARLPTLVPTVLRQAAPSISPPRCIREAQARERSKLGSNHRAAHEMIRRRMLRAAESIIRDAVNLHCTLEEAREELKGTVRSYQEVVHETHRRQELEATTLAAQQRFALRGLDVPCVEVQFPFRSAFEEIEYARRAMEPPRRLPGRPRSS